MSPPDAEGAPRRAPLEAVARQSTSRRQPYNPARLYGHDHQVQRSLLVVHALERARHIIDIALMGILSLDDAPHELHHAMHDATLEVLKMSLRCDCPRCERAA